jgi:hypothetical protein
MQATDRDLWRRLEAFELDDPAASLSFTRRLARENDWEFFYAARVVDEYKRFVFLAMTAGHEVTPSDEVDQAWHLHLTYTRSYWGELCGEVLGRPLHHGPTKGGKAEGDRFEEQYEATLASYRQVFGIEPPPDIWPPSVVRFGEAADFVRVNSQRVWLVPKPWRVQPSIGVAGAFVGLGFGIPVIAAGELNLIGLFVIGTIVTVLLCCVAAFFDTDKRRERRRRRKGADGGDSGTTGGWFGDWGGSGCSSGWFGDWGGSGCGSDSGGGSGCGGGGCGGGGD